MKQKIMAGLDSFSKAMVQPLMYFTVIGIVMIVGVILTNPEIIKHLPFLDTPIIQTIGKVIYESLMLLVNNLGAIFAIGITAAFAKKDKHQAAIIAFMGYLVFLKANNVMLGELDQLAEMQPMVGLNGTGQSLVLGIQVLDTGVFAGIILGVLFGYIFNKSVDTRFKGLMEIYSGNRFSFFLIIMASLLLGVGLTYAWPPVQAGINSIVMFIKESGSFGYFIYGFLDRALIPTGLHHLVYTPFQFSALGGSIEVGGQTIQGAFPIVMAEMNMPIDKFSDSIFWLSTAFTKMFAYIGIVGAFIYTSKKENRKKTISLLIPLLLTVLLAGITEPIDFLFVFTAPILFLIHAIFSGLFLVLLYILDVTALYSGGNIITATLMNVVSGVEKTNYPMMYLLGFIQVVLYFVVFSFLIKKLNLKTPGREVLEEGNKDEGVKTDYKVLTTEEFEQAITGFGGIDNIVNIDNCFTRLRVEVKDGSLVDKELLSVFPSSGVVVNKNNIQVIIGLKVPEYRESFGNYVENKEK